MADWYICPIIGTGEEGDYYRVDYHDEGGKFDYAVIPTDPTTGAPVNGWALCRRRADGPAMSKNDADHVTIPDRSVQLTVQQREVLRIAVVAKGVSWPPPLPGAAYQRGDFHRAVMEALEPGAPKPDGEL